MSENQEQFIEVARLRVGHYVFVDLGWMSHPFPLNRFKISSPDQIATLRSLGLERIRYSPERSDPEPEVAAPTAEDADGGVATADDRVESDATERRRVLLAAQRASLQACERQFGEAARCFRQINQNLHTQPELAREAVQGLIGGFVGNLLGERESCIRLLSEKVGERPALHALNVTIISLLLGRACGLAAEVLQDLGMAALLHDIGKVELPARLRFQDDPQSHAEQQLYQEHVGYGVALGKKMGLPPGVLLAIGQHHEFADGSGYPRRLGGDRLTSLARILALVNRYDNLCNPGNPATALTPHEALSQIFALGKKRFDSTTLHAFVRMMGVYPPGSVVQLSDERYALVVSVNSARPLKPSVLIHDPGVALEEALVVDLEQAGDLGIRRSLRPLQLTKAAIDYLSPRQRMCYFFEHAATAEDGGP